MVRLWMAVALGGALGAMARYGVALALPTRPDGGLPWATLLVNVAGCFLIGILGAAVNLGHIRLSESQQAALFVGLLGGFTTFSAFSWRSAANASSISDSMISMREKISGSLLWNSRA